MKKQGDLYLKIVSIVLAGIVVAYLVLSVLFGSGGSSYTLETAVRCEAGDGQTVSGFVVREEEIITASQPVVVCALTEGERVGSGQRVADGYQTSAAREKRDRLTASSSAVVPRAERGRFAPRSSSSRAAEAIGSSRAGTLLRREARRKSGVCPSSSRSFTSAPRSSCEAMASQSANSAAICSDVRP